MKTSTLISFRCPNCNQHFEIDIQAAGRDFQCTECRFNFKIPVDAGKGSVPHNHIFFQVTSAFAGPVPESPESFRG
jgi:DNA-directed RNA polymerase subunit RPC12/RpoP